MEKLLAIETSTAVCSVALQTGDGRVKEKRIEGRGVHSEYTVLFIDELLDRAGLQGDDLDSVLFSNGPGSYTGLRIGASVIKGLLFGKNVPLFTYPTLISFAGTQLQLNSHCTVHSVIDARRNHLYYQHVKKSGEFLDISDPDIIELEQITPKISEGDIVIGTGWNRLDFKDREKVRWIGLEGISAVNLVHSWNYERLKDYYKEEDVELFEPEYLSMSQLNNSPMKG